LNVYKRDAVNLKGTGTLAGLFDCKFMVNADQGRIWIKLWTEGRDGEEKIILYSDGYSPEHDLVIIDADDWD
jgi:hypothetical protein